MNLIAEIGCYKMITIGRIIKYHNSNLRNTNQKIDTDSYREE